MNSQKICSSKTIFTYKSGVHQLLSFMALRKHSHSHCSVDATRNDGHLGRLMNHSRSAPNVITKAVSVEGEPHLCFFASKLIKEGEELVYDYGDRRKDVLEENKWLAK